MERWTVECFAQKSLGQASRRRIEGRSSIARQVALTLAHDLAWAPCVMW